jgi:hypothetical protein
VATSSRKYALKTVAGLPEFKDDMGGETRRLGTLVPTKERLLRNARKLKAVRPLDPSVWVEFEHDPKEIKIKDQDGRGACFPWGTPIRLADGSWRPIERMQVGDMVLTAEGNYRKVLQTMTRRETDGFVLLHISSMEDPLVLTKEHPVLTDKGYVQAGDIDAGMKVVQTATKRNLTVQSADFQPQVAQVFNLEVEDDHSYVAAGIGVHNCNGHAKASAEEWVRRIAGMQYAALSGWYPYAILCNGVDEGSMIDEALALGRKKGNAREQFVKYGTIDPRQLSAEAHADAANYRILAGEMVDPENAFVEMMATTQRFGTGDYSLRVGANFNDLDEEGVPGYAPGPGNHAVVYGLGAKVAKKGRYRGQWLIKCQNHWSEKWGLKGYFWIPPKFVTGQPYFQAYTVYAEADAPTDPTNPLVAA